MSRSLKTKKNKAVKQIHQDIRNQPDSTNRHDDPDSDEEMQRQLRIAKEKFFAAAQDNDESLNPLFSNQPLHCESSSRRLDPSSVFASSSSLIVQSGSTFPRGKST